jgi:hypothetical protein
MQTDEGEEQPGGVLVQFVEELRGGPIARQELGDGCDQDAETLAPEQAVAEAEERLGQHQRVERDLDGARGDALRRWEGRNQLWPRRGGEAPGEPRRRQRPE